MKVIIDDIEYKPVDSKTSFGTWVDDMCTRYTSEADKYTCVVDGLNKTVKLCCGKKYAIAKCSPDDKFSARVGIALAYARFNNLPIHSELTIKKSSEKEIDMFKFRSHLKNLYKMSDCKTCLINRLAKEQCDDYLFKIKTREYL